MLLGAEAVHCPAECGRAAEAKDSRGAEAVPLAAQPVAVAAVCQ
jgi:hypothetical protein